MAILLNLVKERTVGDKRDCLYVGDHNYNSHTAECRFRVQFKIAGQVKAMLLKSQMVKTRWSCLSL